MYIVPGSKSVLRCVLILLVLTVYLGFSSIALAATTSPEAAWPRTFGHIQFYSSQKREGSFSIARRFGVSLRMLTAMNRRHSSGDAYRIPTMFFPPQQDSAGLVLNIPDRVVYLYDSKGTPIKAYPVAVGRVGWETPTGSFKIIQKRKNPTWFPPAWAKLEKPVPPGPHNPLGDRWMGLSIPGYGLHATNNPRSIGQVASHGCIRMYPEHAHDLFNRVTYGTRVRIVYETILIGFSLADQTFYLTVLPDVYRKGTNTFAKARAVLESAGLGQMVPDETLKRWLKNADGIPKQILGSDLRLVVNDLAVETSFRPTLVGHNYLVPAGTTFASLGAEIQQGTETGSYIITRGEKTLLVRVGSQKALINGADVTLPLSPVLLTNRLSFDPNQRPGLLLVPLGAIRDAFGVMVEVDNKAKEIRLTVAPVEPIGLPVIPPIEPPSLEPDNVNGDTGGKG